MTPNGSRDPDILPEQCTQDGHVFGCTGAAGGVHELIEGYAEPGDDWYADDAGWLHAPLSYENREGDPAFNGAFNRW